MDSLPLTQGAYTARSFIANAQRCVNLFPEKNSDDANAPLTHYPTPGLKLLAAGPQQAAWRGFYKASWGQLYGVCGTGLYSISPAWAYTLLQTISPNFTPVSMKDNQTDMVLVDGTPNGWTINSSNTVTAISDPAFYGADVVDDLDGFMLFNRPGTRDFYTTLDNVIQFDPLYIAAKESSPDKLQTLIQLHREFWLLGEQTSEVWYDSGAADFPFAIFPGVKIEQGCVAKYSVACHDLTLFWLGQNENGDGVVMRGTNYKATRCSTPAIEFAIGQYETISDAQGFIYQQNGHVFYVLTFPSADKTWVYDMTTDFWHEWVSIDSNGLEHRSRVNAAVFAYGINIGGDWENGNLYQIDSKTYTDNGSPIIRRRGFPHLVNNGNRVSYPGARADIQSGESLDPMPQIFLRWSDNRGKSYGNPLGRTMGKIGEAQKVAQWLRLGQARDRVFELFWSTPCETALNGIWLLPPQAGPN